MSSRIRKPPGGDTSNIFDLETRQNIQKNQSHIRNDEIAKQEETQCNKIDNKVSERSSAAPYLGITDKTRVRKPPVGDTNDIFDLEYHQRMQTANVQKSNEDKYPNAYSVPQIYLDNKDFESPSAAPFLGITDLTRVRKPPGGDTNDIFDLEYHQRMQAANVQKSKEDKYPNAYSVNQVYLDISKDSTKKTTENFHSYASYPLSQLSATEFSQPSSRHLDKENISVLSDKMDSFNSKLIDQLIEENLNVQEEEDKEEELKKSSTKKYLCRNPITGEVCEMEVSIRSKLADCSNVVPTQDRNVPNSYDANRTSIRVRQPPGGASSNIF
ncbi:uncharacterized protein CDAR_546241 [Caerostris darwini]|uniref:Microtubule-associated protein Jupiter n=1 Tax=Caerostris darwini TaxID=1538125 RepID=A0AAV4RPL4_9ARAC|nr:uncharacterized protein CDAR_546241 [Caerostris darwini]